MKNWLSPESGFCARAIDDGAAHMRLGVELGLQLLAGAARAGALRAAGLRHEAIDHAMEDDAVVETFAHQLLDPRDMAGRKVGTHLDDDVALGGFEHERVFGIGHVSLFRCLRCLSFRRRRRLACSVILRRRSTAPYRCRDRAARLAAS